LKTILFRVDFSNQFGGGHLKRCLTISSSLSRNFKKYLIIEVKRKNEIFLAKKIIKGYGINSNNIKFFYDFAPSKEIKFLEKKFFHKKINFIVLDFSNLGKIKKIHKIKKYISKLNIFTKKIFLIDSLGKEQLSRNNLFKIDSLITPYAGSEKNRIYSKHFYGGKYFVLNTKKKRHKRKIKQPKKVLITAGQTDPKKVTNKILGSLYKYKNYFKSLEFKVIIGNGFEAEYIKKLNIYKNQKDLNFIFIKNSKDISQHLRGSDIGICTTGLTKYELCYYGVYPIIIAIDQTSHILQKRFDRFKCSDYIGISSQITGLKIIHGVLRALRNRNLRKDFLKRGSKLIDGNGGKRITNTIIK